jgi:hypothetical protein
MGVGMCAQAGRVEGGAGEEEVGVDAGGDARGGAGAAVGSGEVAGADAGRVGGVGFDGGAGGGGAVCVATPLGLILECARGYVGEGGSPVGEAAKY